ncbi:MAG: 2Fe-2S iron-sulfur cluster-binding protein, partial [Alphaproteobacteria bacterium]
MADISFSVNGKPVTAPAAEGDLPLVEFLQDDLRLTGTKFCCGIGVCRACTVAVRRQPGAPP